MLFVVGIALLVGNAAALGPATNIQLDACGCSCSCDGWACAMGASAIKEKCGDAAFLQEHNVKDGDSCSTLADMANGMAKGAATLSKCSGVFKSTTRRLSMVGNDRDEHGCLASAGFTYCATLDKCVRPWVTPCPPLIPRGVGPAIVPGSCVSFLAEVVMGEPRIVPMGCEASNSLSCASTSGADSLRLFTQDSCAALETAGEAYKVCLLRQQLGENIACQKPQRKPAKAWSPPVDRCKSDADCGAGQACLISASFVVPNHCVAKEAGARKLAGGLPKADVLCTRMLTPVVARVAKFGADGCDDAKQVLAAMCDIQLPAITNICAAVQEDFGALCASFPFAKIGAEKAVGVMCASLN